MEFDNLLRVDEVVGSDAVSDEVRVTETAVMLVCWLFVSLWSF